MLFFWFSSMTEGPLGLTDMSQSWWDSYWTRSWRLGRMVWSTTLVPDVYVKEIGWSSAVCILSENKSWKRCGWYLSKYLNMNSIIYSVASFTFFPTLSQWLPQWLKKKQNRSMEKCWGYCARRTGCSPAANRSCITASRCLVAALI